MSIKNATGVELTGPELDTLALLAGGETETGVPQSFFAKSGDDIYVVLDSTRYVGANRQQVQAGTERFVFAKLLFEGGEGCSHYVSEVALFTDQFKATVYLCEQAAEEERGYGGSPVWAIVSADLNDPDDPSHVVYGLTFDGISAARLTVTYAYNGCTTEIEFDAAHEANDGAYVSTLAMKALYGIQGDHIFVVDAFNALEGPLEFRY